MDVAADSVLLHADCQSDLAVGLKSHQAVDHMAAGLFQHFCPVDIIFLVKTGL